MSSVPLMGSHTPGSDSHVHLHYDKGGKMAVACIKYPTKYKIMGAELDHPGYSLSGDPRAVTCPLCKESEVYKSMQGHIDRLIGKRRNG